MLGQRECDVFIIQFSLLIEIKKEKEWKEKGREEYNNFNESFDENK